LETGQLHSSVALLLGNNNNNNNNKGKDNPVTGHEDP
jgi:hypothetical protein